LALKDSATAPKQPRRPEYTEADGGIVTRDGKVMSKGEYEARKAFERESRKQNAEQRKFDR
jgi:hypothetical protein